MLKRYMATYKSNFLDTCIADIDEDGDGDLVLYGDAAALEAENAALREKLAAAEADLVHLNNQITLGLHERHTLLASLGAANRKLSAAEARTVLTDEQIRTMARVYSYRAWGIEQVVEYTRAILAASAAPAAKCQGCNGHGMVGNILDSDTCPFCHGSGHAAPAAQEDEKRLDWLARHGARMRVDGDRWHIDAPYHTGISCVDDHVRFPTVRHAIDAAIAANTPKEI